MKTHQQLKAFGLLFLLGLNSILLPAQNKRGNTWYFGVHAGIDFNSGSPVELSNGMLNTGEGSAAISDAAGNLLFYTDGVNVYNRVHTLMPNGSGLKGGASSTQSAVIVPKPGSPNLYYIFTVAEVLGSLGFEYSIVDMTLSGGMGDITTKNTTILSGPVCEKLAATYHANGKDVWVVAHDITNTYYAYLITATGISAPVISNSGSFFNGAYSYVGYMKFSPSGDRIASANYDPPLMDILDFDKSSGNFSNPNSSLMCFLQQKK
jgi:hypothetical protein